MQSNNTKLIFALTITTIGMVVFAGLFFLSGSRKEREQTITQSLPLIVTNSFTNTVTQEVIKEVPKEVEKIVKVPAEIPAEYYAAMNLYIKMTNAPTVKRDGILFNMQDVRAVYVLSDDIKSVISEDEVKTKYELTLRRNNVALNPNSKNVVIVMVDGFFQNDSKLSVIYSIKSSLCENQWVFRQGQCRSINLPVWQSTGYVGLVGKNKWNEVLINNFEKEAEYFANDYLSANPK